MSSSYSVCSGYFVLQIIEQLSDKKAALDFVYSTASSFQDWLNHAGFVWFVCLNYYKLIAALNYCRKSVNGTA